MTHTDFLNSFFVMKDNSIELSEAEEIKRGEKLVKALKLKKNKETGRYSLGMDMAIKRFLEFFGPLKE